MTGTMSSWAYLALAVAGSALLGVYLLPMLVAWQRRLPASTLIAALNILLGWTGVGWAWALALALGSPRQAAPPRATPARVAAWTGAESMDRAYMDGVYLISSGDGTNTWAIFEDGAWSVVYELGGDERLVARVDSSDIPFSVLAEALAPQGSERW